MSSLEFWLSVKLLQFDGLTSEVMIRDNKTLVSDDVPVYQAKNMWVVNLVVRTIALDQLQGSHETKGLVGSLQLIQQGCSDNQIDHKLVLGFISCSILIISY